MDSPLLGNHWVKSKEAEKKDKYLDIAKELKKQWNMKLTLIPIVIGVLFQINEGLIQGQEDLEISGRVETIETMALLRSAIILRRVLELRRLFVTQNPLREYRLILVWKTLKIVKCGDRK